MKSRDGKERPSGEHGKDKDHGLWPQSGPSEKNLEKIPVAFVRQVLEVMLSFVVAACPGSTKMQSNQRPLTP